jgi:tripartite-type tricarboxylate transporter receptor subunit TctC
MNSEYLRMLRIEITPMKRLLRALAAKRMATRLCAVAVVALASHPASAQTGRTIRLVVPVPAGASTDVIARLTAEQISRSHGVTMVVDNRPGAGGMIGTEFVSRAAPDGNTLLLGANTYLIDTQMRKASYNPVTAFDPVCLLVESPALFLVHSASPYATLQDLIDTARAKPGELSVAAIGPGSAFQIGLINLMRETGTSMTYVPYQGSAPAVTALMGQHVTAAIAGYSVVPEQLKSGALRALAAATPRRTVLVPEVPTFTELGLPGLEVDNWFAVNAPANTPKPVLQQLIEWFKAALDDHEVKAKVAAQGMSTVLTCGDEFGALIRKRYDEYGEAIRNSNLSRPQ